MVASTNAASPPNDEPKVSGDVVKDRTSPALLSDSADRAEAIARLGERPWSFGAEAANWVLDQPVSHRTPADDRRVLEHVCSGKCRCSSTATTPRESRPSNSQRRIR